MCMPGWDTTLRLSKRVAGVSVLLTIAIYAATQTQAPVQSASPQTESKPQSQIENKPPSNPAEPQAGPAPATAPDNSQTANPQDSSHDNNALIIRKDVDEVLLHATVIDSRQRIVTDLDKSAFSVSEDGKPQTIISFRHEDVPVAMAVVIDNSGSMREKRNKVNQAALNLVRASNPRDQVCIVNFNDEYYLDQDFTNDLLRLKEALEKIDARGGTALYEAVVASADHLRRNAQLEKKVLFVVTDGEDNASLETLEQAVKQLQGENGPATFADLFGDKHALVVYSYMFGPQRDRPCPVCTSLLSAWDGAARNVDGGAHAFALRGKSEGRKDLCRGCVPLGVRED